MAEVFGIRTIQMDTHVLKKTLTWRDGDGADSASGLSMASGILIPGCSIDGSDLFCSHRRRGETAAGWIETAAPLRNEALARFPRESRASWFWNGHASTGHDARQLDEVGRKERERPPGNSECSARNRHTEQAVVQDMNDRASRRRGSYGIDAPYLLVVPAVLSLR